MIEKHRGLSNEPPQPKTYGQDSIKSHPIIENTN